MDDADKHYDALETRAPEERERDLLARLPQQIANAKTRAPGFGRILAEVDPQAVTSREALAQLPVTRKSELIELQRNEPPFGGLSTAQSGDLAHLFVSPGPIYDPEARGSDYWRFARALHAMGFRAGQLVHNTFSYHFTPAGFMLEGGAAALGCAVIPAGVGQTEMQAQTIAALRPHGYVGTPSFLQIILDKGDELGLDLSSLQRALVSAEPFPPSVREALAKRGIDGYECYATADLGMIAYQTPAREGLVADEEVLIEIVRPGTGDPVAAGEVGEVLVTSFNETYPLIRFATGDLSAVLAGTSPCGRTNMRIKGWMGRADQTTKVKGMFVHPSQIAEVLRRHGELGKGRLVVDRQGNNDTMTLRCESGDTGAELAAAVAETLQAVTKLKGEVVFVEPGALPNDGKVIDDIRTYE